MTKNHVLKMKLMILLRGNVLISSSQHNSVCSCNSRRSSFLPGRMPSLARTPGCSAKIKKSSKYGPQKLNRRKLPRKNRRRHPVNRPETCVSSRKKSWNKARVPRKMLTSRGPNRNLIWKMVLMFMLVMIQLCVMQHHSVIQKYYVFVWKMVLMFNLVVTQL